MSEELLQRDLLKNPPKIGKWDFYNVGATSIKQLKEAQIIRNVDYGKEEKKKIDALLVQKKNVIVVIEFKKPSEFNTKAKQRKAILQELEVAKKLDAHIIIATDTKESIWVNILTGNTIKDEDGGELKFNFNSSDEKLPELIEKIVASINEKNDQIKPKSLVNPTDLAKQIWQDIWISSGESPTNSLYTFVELFIFKYLSDLKILGQGLDFNHLMERYDYNLENPEEQALDYYANNIRPYIKKLFPEGLDKTTIINGSVFVNKEGLPDKRYSGVFKKVLIKFKNYGRLENIDYDFKSKLFEVFLKESISKKNLGQFFTPIKVVRAIGEMVKDEIKPNIKICDPASGVGKFLLEPIRTKIDQLFEVKKGEIISKIQIHGFDKGFEGEEQKTIILAKANMLIYFSDLIKDNPTITNKFSELFNKSFELKTNSILGTLSYPIENEYDLILTNPPYVTSGSGSLKEEISNNTELKDYYKVNAMGVEGLFMEWIVRALKPGGKAFIIVPDGIFNRQNDKNLRRFLLDECYIDGIISLPIKTFFTTPKKTYILCITKKEDKKTTQTDPVFTYLVSEMGESRDVYRFDIEQDDLSEAVNLYSFFKGNKKGFEKINSDKRCKIQSIEKFDSDTYWSIERWWTKEEQIELGIAEEDKVVKFDDFGEIIIDMSETLKGYSTLLKEVTNKKKVNNFKKVSLTNNQYFDLFIGKRLVKKDLIHIKGNIPIYSANVKEPISFHTQSNIDDFSNNFVIWGIDGNFEYNFIPKEQPFVTTDHCGTIRILSDNILPEYLLIQLEKVKHKYGFDRGLRSSLKNMKLVSVEIPFDENGNIDIEKQKEIAEKYSKIEQIKKSISAEFDKITNIEIDYE
jgi:type I restriction enzyme M protein